MEETKINPAVVEPSHAPNINLTINSPLKSVHAAWHMRAIAHTAMFKLW